MPYCYVIDSYGVMHNWGMVRNPASFPATNNPIIALGSNQQGEFQNHYPVYDSSLGFSYVGSDGGQAGHSANGINWKAAGTANGWMCLSNVRVVLAGNTIPWVDTRGGNGWTRYTSGGATLFSPIQFGSYHQARILRGLMGGGTVNAYYSPLPRGYRPVFNMWDSVPSSTNGLLFATVAAAAKGRADIKNYGQAFVQSGSNTWFAVDGLTYVAEG